MDCTEWLSARAVMIRGTTSTSGSRLNPRSPANPSPQIALSPAEITGSSTPCQVRKYRNRSATMRRSVAASTL